MHNPGILSAQAEPGFAAELVRSIRGPDRSQDELAVRAGFSRVTISRWESGERSPTLEELRRLAAATGRELNTTIVDALNPDQVRLANQLLDRGPTYRLQQCASRSRWQLLGNALGAASWLSELAVIVGPTAAAIRGAPVRVAPPVDLLADSADVSEIVRVLERDVGAVPNGVDRHERAERTLWALEGGAAGLAIRTEAGPAGSANEIRERSTRAVLSTGTVRVALFEDLVDSFLASPWPKEQAMLPKLRAVFAARRYTARDPGLADV